MLFFDDEHYNIRDITKLGMLLLNCVSCTFKYMYMYVIPHTGVTCYFIEDGNGLTLARLKEGLEQHNSKHS